MTVALPTNGINNATPRFVDRGGILEAALGGDDQRLDRLGSKFGCNFSTKPMKAEEARIWIARLIRGKREKASIKFPQPGLVNQWSGDGTISAVGPNAEIVNVFPNNQATDLGKVLKEGQFLSLVVNGKRYLHQVTSDGLVISDPGGNYCSVVIQPPTRITIPNGTVAEILTPTIEGYVKGDEFSWNIDNAKIYGLTFDIEEAA